LKISVSHPFFSRWLPIPVDKMYKSIKVDLEVPFKFPLTKKPNTSNLSFFKLPLSFTGEIE
jgi:hypothetical protein